MTRTDKFRYYHRNYLGRELSDKEMAELCQHFSELVVDKVVAAPEISGAGEFLNKWCFLLPCFVISATPEEEVREIIKLRGMKNCFKEVLGAPASKNDNLARLLIKFRLNSAKCCLFGDAESDYKAAYACGVKFIGIAKDKDTPLVRAQPGIRYTKDFTEMESKLALSI
jgi:phosphoglycolate phosphatase-like HAD superfamily hydrolase